MVLTSGDCPDVLSHSAVRARNMGVLMAACLSDEVRRETRLNLQDSKKVKQIVYHHFIYIASLILDLSFVP